MSACAHKTPAQEYKIPKAKDIVGRSWCNAPKHVIEKIASEYTWFIGVDIETHDWGTSRGNKGNFGKFGFYNLCNQNDLEARIVQLGWSFGPPGEDQIIKERLVYPEGFKISEKAAKYHGISNDLATINGRALKDVLNEFMNDVTHVIEKHKGRIVCHHLQFKSS